MDMRALKTRRNIHNAFLAIRSKKSLEKITVKELCDKAEISKATFYLHYKDIYDLSDQLQMEVVNNIISFGNDPEELIRDPLRASHSMINGYISNKGLVTVLFSGSQFSRLPEKIEDSIKQLLFSQKPELKDDVFTNVKITYQLMGSFYAIFEYEKKFGAESVIEAVDKMSALFY